MSCSGSADDQGFSRKLSTPRRGRDNNGRALPLITSVCYVRLAVSEPSASARFMSDIFGLQRVADQDGEIGSAATIAFRTVSLAGIRRRRQHRCRGLDDKGWEEIGRRLRDLGFKTRGKQRQANAAAYVQSALLAEDASGTHRSRRPPSRRGRRYFPAPRRRHRRVSWRRLRTTDHIRDPRLLEGARRQRSATRRRHPYLRIDGMHHRVALYPSKRNGLLYAAFEVEALDQIMQNAISCRKVRSGSCRPRAPAASRQIFLHVEGPDGLIFSYVNGMAKLATGRGCEAIPASSDIALRLGSESKDVPELGAPG